jgi:hypothetical protein
MKTACYFTLKQRDPERSEKEAYCIIHGRWADQCDGDPIDDMLSHLEREGGPKKKICPHCGGPLNE